MIEQLIDRFERAHRPELYLALVALILFFIAQAISMSMENFTMGSTFIELAVFFKKVALFFGGFVTAVFAAPHMKAHGANNNVGNTISIYASRYAVGIAFLLTGA